MAKEFSPQSAEKRDIIAEAGSIPAFPLTFARDQANKVLDHGWPGAKHIRAPGPELVPIMLVSDELCMRLLARRV